MKLCKPGKKTQIQIYQIMPTIMRMRWKNNEKNLYQIFWKEHSERIRSYKLNENEIIIQVLQPDEVDIDQNSYRDRSWGWEKQICSCWSRRACSGTYRLLLIETNIQFRCTTVCSHQLLMSLHTDQFLYIVIYWTGLGNRNNRTRFPFG